MSLMHMLLVELHDLWSGKLRLGPELNNSRIATSDVTGTDIICQLQIVLVFVTQGLIQDPPPGPNFVPNYAVSCPGKCRNMCCFCPK